MDSVYQTGAFLLNFLILLANGVTTDFAVNWFCKRREAVWSQQDNTAVSEFKNSVRFLRLKCHVAYNVVSGPFNPWNTWVIATFP